MRIRSEQAGQVEATALQQVGTREVGFSGFGDSVFGSHPVASTGVGFAPSSSSPPPPPPPPPSAPEPQGLAGLFSGLLGSGARSSSPAPQRPKAEPRGTLPAGAASAAGPTDREILIAGMHQLQDAMPALNPGGAVIIAASSRTAKCPNARLNNCRFFKAFVRQLPRCQPLSCLMHQVRSQVMVQFRGSTASRPCVEAFCLSHAILQSR